MALPRELVDVMQLTGTMSGQDAAGGEEPGRNLAAAAALVGDFATESASGSLDRLLMLCEDGGDPLAAAGLAAEACDRAALLDDEVRRFLKTAGQL
jgi:hypothetical protein